MKLAVIPGDGVGPEVVTQAEKVLRAVAEHEPSISIQFDHFPWSSDFYLDTGQMMPDNGIEILSTFDAILFGAVGSPRVKDYITLQNLVLRIRTSFDQYVNLRPIRLLPGVVSPLREATPPDIDIIFVREGTEGEYAGLGGRMFPNTEREVALQTGAFSRQGVNRVMRWAFECARHEDRSVTSVSKGNALRYSGGLWDEIFAEISADYPDVETHELLVDAAAMFLVRDPKRFEIVVGSNLYMDILTDLAAALVGGLGVAPSANLNPENRYPSMFEPIHGSAPDIQGRSIANPVGSIWSAALMLAHFGHRTWADAVVRAIERSVLDPRTCTLDLGGSATTEEVGDAVVAMLDHEATAR